MFILFAFLTITASVFGQKAMTFDEATHQGIRISYLDSIYASGIQADSSLSVFKNQEEYIVTYQTLLHELGIFLHDNGFLWKKPTACFNRIYFSKNGKIDYFLYRFRPDQLTQEQQQAFKKLLNKFIRKYRFGLQGNKKFSQCSPVTYMPLGG